MYGKDIRMRKIKDINSGRIMIVPMDHGATMGPLQGIENIGKVVNVISKNYVNGVVVCKGQMSNHEFIENCQVPIFVHLSNSNILSPRPNSKTLMGSVENAISLGADAISVHINIGDDNEHRMLKDLGKVADDCYRWGMPLLAMMYVRSNDSMKDKVENIKLAARIAAESGADIVKVNYTGSIESFKEVVDGCHVPVIIAGGNTTNTQEILKIAADAVKAGAKGIACGRNVFQSPNPEKMLRALDMIIHKDINDMEAYRIVKNDLEIIDKHNGKIKEFINIQK